MNGIAPTGPSLLAPDARLAREARSGDPRALAREAAKTLVTEAFVKPVFAALRDGTLAADGFKPGTAERRFRPLLDAALAEKVVEGSNFALVDTVATRFEKTIAGASRRVDIRG